MFCSLNRSSHQQSEHTLPDTWSTRNLVPPEVSARYLQGIPGSHMQLPSISLGWCVTRLRLSIEINIMRCHLNMILSWLSTSSFMHMLGEETGTYLLLLHLVLRILSPKHLNTCFPLVVYPCIFAANCNVQYL